MTRTVRWPFILAGLVLALGVSPWFVLLCFVSAEVS